MHSATLKIKDGCTHVVSKTEVGPHAVCGIWCCCDFWGYCSHIILGVVSIHLKMGHI